jgi:hypothetical protein
MHLQPDGAQLLGQNAGSAMFFKPQFRMGMNIAAQRDEGAISPARSVMCKHLVTPRWASGVLQGNQR